MYQVTIRLNDEEYGRIEEQYIIDRIDVSNNNYVILKVFDDMTIMHPHEKIEQIEYKKIEDVKPSEKGLKSFTDI